MRPQDDGTGRTLEQGEVEPVVGHETPQHPEDEPQAPSPDETDFQEQNPDFATGEEPMALPEDDDEEKPVEDDREIPGEESEGSAEAAGDEKGEEEYSGPNERDFFEMRLEAERRRAEAAWKSHDKISGKYSAAKQELERVRQAQRSAGMPGGSDVTYQHPQNDPGQPPAADPGVQELLERQRSQDLNQERAAIVSEYHAAIREFDTNLQRQFGVNGENTSPQAQAAYKQAVERVNQYVVQRQQDLQRAAASMDPMVMRAETASLLTEGLMEAIGQNVRRSHQQAQGARERARRRRDLSAPPTSGAVRQRRRRSTFPSDPADIEKLSPAELEQFYKQIGRKGF